MTLVLMYLIVPTGPTKSRLALMPLMMNLGGGPLYLRTCACAVLKVLEIDLMKLAAGRGLF